MSISFELPAELERDLREALGDLSQVAKEAFIIENYRCGRLSIGDVADLLGYETRFQAEQWLGGHGVHQNYSLDDLESDRKTLERVMGPVKH